jgi:hypothetical protein
MNFSAATTNGIRWYVAAHKYRSGFTLTILTKEKPRKSAFG